ncbi:hypothetical protein VTL71DRAFT_13041 [Oculimacula yallundae]|uniref:Uncharacterized protein n=1 Tax=Oculimacula yallundae TaxID=86028 RepID=A0ABR4CRH4_9HELO
MIRTLQFYRQCRVQESCQSDISAVLALAKSRVREGSIATWLLPCRTPRDKKPKSTLLEELPYLAVSSKRRIDRTVRVFAFP